MGKLEFAGRTVEITPEDYYLLMLSTLDRALHCQKGMEIAHNSNVYDYWRKERDKAEAVRLKLFTHKE